MRKYLGRMVFSTVLAFSSLSLTNSVVADESGYNKRPAIWQGIYSGGHIGGAFTDFGKAGDFLKKIYRDRTEVIDNGPAVADGVLTAETSDDSDSISGGIHIGYNIQKNNIVLGVEADVSFLNSSLSGNISEDDPIYSYDQSLTIGIDYLASLRGRLGVAVSDKALLYLTGGVAWTQIDAEFNKTEYLAGGNTNKSNSQSETLTGYVVGGGAEYKIGQNTSLRGEALYYGFESDDEYFAETDLGITVVRGGISWHFN